MSGYKRNVEDALRRLKAESLDQVTEAWVERVAKEDPEVAKNPLLEAEYWIDYQLIRSTRRELSVKPEVKPEIGPEAKPVINVEITSKVSEQKERESAIEPDIKVVFHYFIDEYSFDSEDFSEALYDDEDIASEIVDELHEIENSLTSSLSKEFFQLPHRLSDAWSLINYELEVSPSFLSRIREGSKKRVPIDLSMEISFAEQAKPDWKNTNKEATINEFIEKELQDRCSELAQIFSQSISHRFHVNLDSCSVKKPKIRKIAFR